jgi:hypothetical protein
MGDCTLIVLWTLPVYSLVGLFLRRSKRSPRGRERAGRGRERAPVISLDDCSPRSPPGPRASGVRHYGGGAVPVAKDCGTAPPPPVLSHTQLKPGFEMHTQVNLHLTVTTASLTEPHATAEPSLREGTVCAPPAYCVQVSWSSSAGMPTLLIEDTAEGQASKPLGRATFAML